MPEFEDWAWRCEVYGCNAQICSEGPGPDWQEEQPYAPPDPGSLTGEWELVADNDDVVPPGCERRPWQRVNVKSFALDPRNPDVMYIGMFNEETGGVGWAAGAYKSVDGGRTWFSAWAGLGGLCYDVDGVPTAVCPWCRWGVTVRELFVDPDDPQLVFASTDERGMYRTVDGGQHWTEVHHPGYTANRPGMVRRAIDGTLYHTGGGDLLRSRDGGQSWEHLSYPSQNRLVDVIAPDPARAERIWLGMAEPLVLGSGEGPILVSDDGGLSWRELGHAFLEVPGWGENVRDLAVCPADPSRVAAAVVAGGVWLSPDCGETWRRAEELSDATGALAVGYAPLPDRCLLFAADLRANSTWWTEDDGASWGRLAHKCLHHLAFNPYVPEMAFGIVIDTVGDSKPFELWVRR